MLVWDNSKHSVYDSLRQQQALSVSWSDAKTNTQCMLLWDNNKHSVYAGLRQQQALSVCWTCWSDSTTSVRVGSLIIKLGNVNR